MTLVERLRDGQEIHNGDWSMLDEAAERIEAAEKLIEQLVEALQMCADNYYKMEGDEQSSAGNALEAIVASKQFQIAEK